VDVECFVGWIAAGRIPRGVDPLLKGVRAKLNGRYETSDKLAGARRRMGWKTGLKASIPIPVGAFDATGMHRAGARTGDVVNVVGTSTASSP